MQVEAHNAQHSFPQQYRNLFPYILDISPTNSPRINNCLRLFSYLHCYHNLLICLNRKILLQQVTPRIKHLQLQNLIEAISEILETITLCYNKNQNGEFSFWYIYLCSKKIYFCVVFCHHCLLEKVQVLALLHSQEMNIQDLKS